MFCVFARFLKITAPGGGGLWHNFFAPAVGVMLFLCVRGVGNSPFPETSHGFARGDGKAWN